MNAGALTSISNEYVWFWKESSLNKTYHQPTSRRVHASRFERLCALLEDELLELLGVLPPTWREIGVRLV